MPLLTVTNLTAKVLTLQEPNAEYRGLVVRVPASGSVTGLYCLLQELAALEPQLIAETTAGNITWSATVDPGHETDQIPAHQTTVLVTPYDAVAGDQVILVNLSSPGASSVVLPLSAMIGQTVKVIDAAGNAGTDNITVTVASSGTINGGANVVVNTNYGQVTLTKVGTNAWLSLGSASISSAAAGGDLTGTYPNPTIASGVVTETMLIGTLASAPQALSGAGAVNVTARTTLFTSTGAANALTLANGTRTGQRKTLIHTVKGASGTGVLTPATGGNFATATLTALKDAVELEWSGSAWNVVGYSGTASFT